MLVFRASSSGRDWLNFCWSTMNWENLWGTWLKTSFEIDCLILELESGLDPVPGLVPGPETVPLAPVPAPVPVVSFGDPFGFSVLNSPVFLTLSPLAFASKLNVSKEFLSSM